MLPRLARIGDQIETTVRHPTPGVIRMTLETPEACAYANDLLMNQKSGWQLVQPLARQGGQQQ